MSCIETVRGWTALALATQRACAQEAGVLRAMVPPRERSVGSVLSPNRPIHADTPARESS